MRNTPRLKEEISMQSAMFEPAACGMSPGLGADATISERLADFAASFELGDAPPAVMLRAKHLLLDAVGCGFAAREQEFARRIAGSVAKLAGPGQHGVL